MGVLKLDDKSKVILQEVLFRVFSTFAYMYAEPAKVHELILTENEFWWAELTAQGKFKAHFSLALPKSLSYEMAANILGLEPQDDLARADAEDSVKEFLNIVSNHVLTRLAGETVVFNMGIPDAKELSGAQVWNQLKENDNTVAGMVEGHPVFFNMEYL